MSEHTSKITTEQELRKRARELARDLLFNTPHWNDRGAIVAAENKFLVFATEAVEEMRGRCAAVCRDYAKANRVLGCDGNVMMARALDGAADAITSLPATAGEGGK